MNINLLINRLKKAPYYTKQNLSIMLEKDGNDLNYWIKKLLREKILISLKKGFYISAYYKDLVNQDPKESSEYLEYLANKLRYPSYVSLEYVLAKKNFIPEAVFTITSVTTKSTRNYSSKFCFFSYRNIKKKLYSGFQLTDFRDKNVRIATLAKALFDFLYFRDQKGDKSLKNYLLIESRFNWNILGKKDSEEFKEIINFSNSSKMKKICEILGKEGIL